MRMPVANSSFRQREVWRCCPRRPRPDRLISEALGSRKPLRLGPGSVSHGSETRYFLSEDQRVNVNLPLSSLGSLDDLSGVRTSRRLDELRCFAPEVFALLLCSLSSVEPRSATAHPSLIIACSARPHPFESAGVPECA